MFITAKRRGYDRHGQQVASGLFLILMEPSVHSTKYPYPIPVAMQVPGISGYPIRALIRFTSMSQFGQFMMGHARVGKDTLTLSGSYGGDGLPDMVPDAVYERGLPLPQFLYDAWKNGGGWNEAGTEAIAMRKWALENLPTLRK